MASPADDDQSKPANFTAYEKLQKDQYDLFVATTKRNQQLEHELSEARREVAVYKSAYAALTQDNEGLQTKFRSAQGTLESLTEQNPLAVTLIDGDGYIFGSEYLKQGRSGGHQVASKLNQEISKAHGSRRIPNLTIVYVNQGGLSEVLHANGLIASKADFDQFVIGFNQSSPLFSIVDAGAGKEAADVKIKEMLRVFARFPQVKQIYFGGAHDGGYARDLMALQTEGLLDKIRLLNGNNRKSAEIESLDIPVTTISDVFYNLPLENTRRTANVRAHSNNINTGAGEWAEVNSVHSSDPTTAESRQSTPSPPPLTNFLNRSVYLPDRNDGAHTLRIDPQQAIRKQKPMPCMNYYLNNNRGCRFGDKCKYSHSYFLGTKHLAQFRDELQIIPCGRGGPNGFCKNKDCLYGHSPTNLSSISNLHAINASSRSNILSFQEHLEMKERDAEIPKNSSQPPRFQPPIRSTSPSSSINSMFGTTAFRFRLPDTTEHLFLPLLSILDEEKARGENEPSQVSIGMKFSKNHSAPEIYRALGVPDFGHYVQLAVDLGVIIVRNGPSKRTLSLV